MMGNRRAWRSSRLALLNNLRRQPDRDVALARYARLANEYENTTMGIRGVRQRAIDLLDLKLGETVFDVACGNGAIFNALARRVDPRGRVVGIDQSPEMAALARDAANGAQNIEVLCDPV